MSFTASKRERAEEETELPPQLPIGTRGYFACRRCRRILAEMQWYQEGCLECGTGAVPRGELMDHATPHFANFIGLIAPEQSWVARRIRKLGCANGVFAEALSDEDVDELDEPEEMAEDDEDVELDEEDNDAQPSDVAKQSAPMSDAELINSM